MTHAFITVVIPFKSEHAARVNGCLDALGNPAHGVVAARLHEIAFVHFLSIMVLPEPREPGERPKPQAHLILEASTDGIARNALDRLTTAIGDTLHDVLNAADLKVTLSDLGAYLEERRVNVGPGWLSTLGVVFAGAPGMSVERIKNEARFASALSAWLKDKPRPESALQKLERARNEFFRTVQFKWAFIAEPIPLLRKQSSVASALPRMGISLLRQLLWPLLVLLPLVTAALAYYFGSSLLDIVIDVMLALVLGLLAVGIGLGITYRLLRRRERSDEPRDVEPSATHAAQLALRENVVRQNHLGGATILKPGRLGRVILRLVFWTIGAWTTYAGPPGFLYKVGTIHFARWFVLPGTDQLVFLSHYDGSWESYLEDFIARAYIGMNAIWSNSRNFPKTTNLIKGGARDGERFKRWARRYQSATHFWFPAYPDLTTARIRTNAAIRHGFASASSEESAAEWLTHLGVPSAPAFESGCIPTLVFGGLSRLRHAHCLIVELANDSVDCRQWLQETAASLCYGDQMRTTASAMAAGFSASGLRKLGLDEATMATFPTAFQQGMAAPWRARTLGDTGTNAHHHWQWGDPSRPADAIILVYAKDSATLESEVLTTEARLHQYGHHKFRDIAMETLPDKSAEPVREPFGFIDGISQPIIRGTSQYAEPHNEDQVVEAGEIILGYRDNLGYIPPIPDANGFALGKNGTFLVARQLEQDPDAFNLYLTEGAADIARDPRSPSTDPTWLREWLAAKMVGRWREDGSSLVRHPTPPRTPNRATVAEDNDFRFGAEDPDGLRCPLGAHIRRANPRDSSEPGSKVQIGITNRHRILRVGRAYHSPDNHRIKRGLLFMCLNSDIERQFEFLQQTWLLGRNFQGLNDEGDPLTSHHPNHAMSIPTHSGPLQLRQMNDFVTTRGGGYFFMPGKDAVDFLWQLQNS